MKQRPNFLGLVTSNPNTGKQTLQPPAQTTVRLLRNAKRLGEMQGEVHGFAAGHRRGLRLGLVVGIFIGCIVVATALQLGAAL